MSITYLSPKKLHDAILAGCQTMMVAREELNRINIFPVADGDTGDNLASTAGAIIKYSSQHPSFKAMLRSVADASVMGARGNSGIIFSQFFNAFAEDVNSQDTLDLHEFSSILVNVAGVVRKSLASPVDGTMLTMIEVFSSTLSHFRNKSVCFYQVMQNTLPIMREALQKTSETIVILKKNDIVDAGAFGFFLFVQGIADFLSDKPFSLPSEPELAVHPLDHEMMVSAVHPIHRYCTEVILRANSIDRSRLTEFLENQGDCLGITGNERICRFHLHTNQPWELFSALIDHGTIEHPKVDDMLRQFEMVHQRKHDIALVTDSGADIPQKIRDKHQIHLLPFMVCLDEHTLLDRYCYDPGQFYQKLLSLKKHPKTSLPSLAFIEEKLSHLSRHYRQILVLSVSRAMSGTYGVLVKAAQKFNNIHVIDSRTSSGAQGLLLEYAGELLDAGCSFQTITKAIEASIDKARLFVVVNQIESMIRSGRIGKFVGRIGQLSRVKPILTISNEGIMSPMGTVFNVNSGLLKIIEMVRKAQRETGKHLKRYCIVHSDVLDKAEEFEMQTTEAFQMPPAYIEQVSTAVGLHVGQGCIALAFRLSE